MKAFVGSLVKAGLMFVIKRYAASLVFDLIVEQAEKLSRRTDTEIDDKAVAMLKQDKNEFIAALKGRI